jgi:hypothetical protein
MYWNWSSKTVEKLCSSEFSTKLQSQIKSNIISDASLLTFLFFTSSANQILLIHTTLELLITHDAIACNKGHRHLCRTIIRVAMKLHMLSFRETTILNYPCWINHQSHAASWAISNKKTKGLFFSDKVINKVDLEPFFISFVLDQFLLTSPSHHFKSIKFKIVSSSANGLKYEFCFAMLFWSTSTQSHTTM